MNEKTKFQKQMLCSKIIGWCLIAGAITNIAAIVLMAVCGVKSYTSLTSITGFILLIIALANVCWTQSCIWAEQSRIRKELFDGLRSLINRP